MYPELCILYLCVLASQEENQKGNPKNLTLIVTQLNATLYFTDLQMSAY